jgi:hypothetical protein
MARARKNLCLVSCRLLANARQLVGFLTFCLCAIMLDAPGIHAGAIITPADNLRTTISQLSNGDSVTLAAGTYSGESSCALVVAASRNITLQAQGIAGEKKLATPESGSCLCVTYNAFVYSFMFSYSSISPPGHSAPLPSFPSAHMPEHMHLFML